MSLIVDASVAVKWVAEEPGSDKAQALYGQENELAAPTLILAEVGNALWKKFRMKLVPPQQVHQAIEALPRYIDWLCELTPLAPQAAELAVRLDHPIYDCFYIALAQRENATLVSADDRQLAAAKKARVKVRRL